MHTRPFEKFELFDDTDVTESAEYYRTYNGCIPVLLECTQHTLQFITDEKSSSHSNKDVVKIWAYFSIYRHTSVLSVWVFISGTESAVICRMQHCVAHPELFGPFQQNTTDWLLFLSARIARYEFRISAHLRLRLPVLIPSCFQ